MCIHNCAVKSRQRENGLEVLVSSQIKMHDSPMKFKLDEKMTKGSCKSNEVSALEIIADMADNQYVSVKGKAASMLPIQEVIIKSSG